MTKRVTTDLIWTLHGSMKLLQSERPRIMFWKMWYRFDVSWQTVVFIVQTGLKLYNFSIVAARVETSTKRGGSRFRGRGRNVVQQQWIKQLGKRSFNLFCITFYFIWTFGAAWTQSYIVCRLKDVILCSIIIISREKCRPFWLSVLF